MGAKTFPLLDTELLRLNASVAIFTFPLIFTINDVITEVYGRERTRSVIRAALVVVALIFLFALLATALPPSVRFAEREAAYDSVFQSSARIAFASLLAFGAAEITDVYVFLRIRQALGTKALWFRNNISNFAAQLLDTILFMTLAFYALDRGVSENISFLLSLIIPYWLLKCAMSVIETPFVYLGVRWLRENDEVRVR